MMTERVAKWWLISLISIATGYLAVMVGWELYLTISEGC